MADRFPLIVNAVSKKIEELVAGDNLDLTGNGIVVGGDTGNGKYLTSDGTQVFWDNPGDVYLNQTQILTNKTLENSVISGTVNTITDLPNSALVNSGITLNGNTVFLGGSITTPNDNTTYGISAVDGLSATEKLIRLTAGGSGAGTDDVKISVVSPTSIPSGYKALELTLTRQDDTISFSGIVEDSDTRTRLQSGTGGSLVSGDITIAAGNFTTVSQSGNIITITGQDTNTVTELRAGVGQAFNSGNFTFLDAGATTLTQGVDGNGDATITVSSDDTITRLRAGTLSPWIKEDITVQGGGDVVVSQNGQTITVSLTDQDTITTVQGRTNANGGTASTGAIVLEQAGATTITQSGNTITISSANDNTTYSASGGGGIQISGTNIVLKNNVNLVENKHLKWDSVNGQLVNSLISDDGSTITIDGDLVVEGTQTTLNTTTLQVEDRIIELRRGVSLVGQDAGIQINRTTDSSGTTVSFVQLQWYEAGSYWRSYDGSVSKRFVTENDTQTLSFKTLQSPDLITPSLGVASATSINGLGIATTSGAELSIAEVKTVSFGNTVSFESTDGIQVNLRNGGDVAYKSDTLGAFSATTSEVLRGIITDTTGSERLVFQNNPVFKVGLRTDSISFNLLDTTATTINFGGQATTIDIGAATGSTSIKNNLVVDENTTLGTDTNQTINVNGVMNVNNSDIYLYSTGTPITVGRGEAGVTSNTVLGYNCLYVNESGSRNTAVGYQALSANLIGASNTAIGRNALRTSNGSWNTAVGDDALDENLNGEGNVALGYRAMEQGTDTSYNVCIGYYAGNGLAGFGKGNVLIGPAYTTDPATGSLVNSGDATFAPPLSGSNTQLVIGSGPGYWVKGDSSYNVTIGNGLIVNGTTTLQGDLVVNGTTTTVNSSTISVDDKAIELAAVSTIQFVGQCTVGSNQITSVASTTGLLIGMSIVSFTGGISFTEPSYITDITGDTVEVSSTASNTGNATIEATGPSDTAADGGGIILKGAPSDHSILYDHNTVSTDRFWVFSEGIKIPSGRRLQIGNDLLLSGTTLGASVVNSSLTSVGTLATLSVDGATTLGGRVVEKVLGNFSGNTLTPSSGTLTLSLGAGNTIVGTPSTDAINTWAFTGVNLANNQSITATVILSPSNTAATYGDACTVDGNTVLNGVQWSGGTPPLATANTDILTFVIVRDGSGVIKVYGQGNTDFS